MQKEQEQLIVTTSSNWILDVVIGCNFCPFAAREVNKNAVKYQVLEGSDTEAALHATVRILLAMDEDKSIATALLILPKGFDDFEKYLDLVSTTEWLIKEEAYEGIYQVASFHPNYLFAGSDEEDPSNYTNRSPYPMLHFLREDMVSKAVDGYADIDEIPIRNIEFAKEKGLRFMQQLLAASKDVSRL
ncbi:MAG: DUF1415 domain-containing protein [Ferruginibacter sp.]